MPFGTDPIYTDPIYIVIPYEIVASPPLRHLLTITRIKAEAASNPITSVEISAQRLMLQRNGRPILMDGSRYPRLAKTKPGEKLEEALEMLENF
ncbi:MAG: hypothetical protein ABJQ29_08405 [Luteolibacter sp.]